MPISRLIRQTHHWTSLVFALLVAGIFVALGLGSEPAQWVYFLPLPPLFLLLLTCLYLFVLPYLDRSRRTARPECAAQAPPHGLIRGSPTYRREGRRNTPARRFVLRNLGLGAGVLRGFTPHQTPG